MTLVMGRRGGEPSSTRSPLRTLLRSPGRQTNQALLVVLLLAFGTGVATVAIGSPDGAWVAIGHGICGVAVVLLIPWKSRVVRGGLRRALYRSKTNRVPSDLVFMRSATPPGSTR